jgi:Ca2+/Na+ antiporter
VSWSIWRGVLNAPEDSDSDDSDYESDTAEVVEADSDAQDAEASENSPLLLDRTTRRHSVVRILLQLFGTFLALSLSGYVLAHSSQLLARRFGLSETLFGATILSLGTTLPEKLIAIVGGCRGHPGIVVANTVGSNIFLLTLCLGLTILSTERFGDASSYRTELIWAWTSSALLMAVIALGSIRAVGLAMLLAYVAFLVMEFWLYKR